MEPKQHILGGVLPELSQLIIPYAFEKESEKKNKGTHYFRKAYTAVRGGVNQDNRRCDDQHQGTLKHENLQVTSEKE